MNGVGILIIGKYTRVIGRFENDEQAPSNSMKIDLDDKYTNKPVKSVYLSEVRINETG